MNSPRTRKPREIKNTIIELDDVRIPSGFQNMNWLPIARQKLIVRELRILYNRQQILDRLVIATIQQFVHDNQTKFNFTLCMDIYKQEIRHKLVSSQSAIMSLYAHSIGNTVQKWKGYKPDKEEIHSFRNYFQRCRCWFDTKKIELMAINVWIPSMQLIQEFAMKAAARLFGGNQDRDLWTSFTDYLHVLVLRSAFEGYIKPPNGRSMWLVSAMSYRTFLKRYNHHLHVVVKTQPKKDKAMRTEYLKGVEIRYGALTKAFDRGMKKYLSPSVCVSPQVENQINPFNTTTNVLLVFESNGSMVGYKISF
eukprot:737737_1